MTQARTPTSRPPIRCRGVKQNNLKNLDIDIDAGVMTVVTGKSGSGKSSLVFDTLYAEGQRRYVETFSPYTRQFLDRMNRPHADKIDGIAPAIAIDAKASVRTSRSTVGTMSELNDHLKLLFAHHAHLFCPDCGIEVQDWHAMSIWHDIQKRLIDTGEIEARVFLTFEVAFPLTVSMPAALEMLSSQGFTRVLEPLTRQTDTQRFLTVVADRFKGLTLDRTRALEAIENAIAKAQGKLTLYIQASPQDTYQALATYQEGLVCSQCQRTFERAQPHHFSFNSPIGACEHCRGFGRVIELDRSKVIDPNLSLITGAIAIGNHKHFSDEMQELIQWLEWEMGYCADTPLKDLPPEVMQKCWSYLDPFFSWLESKSYKPHVKALLNKFRTTVTCPSCQGAHLKPPATWWRLGRKLWPRTPGKDGYFYPVGVTLDEASYLKLPGLNFHECMTLPIHSLQNAIEQARPEVLDDAQRALFDEIQSRLGYLNQVGLGYLTLDRQSRTLSGGEVQRVNLTTALGTQLVNTLFLLDEPSIGLHPRDLARVNDVMRRLTALGNTLVVVEHDPQVMLAGQKLLDLGPGAGFLGGEIVYHGSTQEALNADTLTAQYLRGQKRITRKTLPVNDTTPSMVLTGARVNNLREPLCRIPLARMTVLAGVSGSGKSTLMENVLKPHLEAFLQHQSTPAELGSFVLNAPKQTQIHELIYVDQSPIGKSARATPVSYVKAFDEIRRFFGDSPEAIERGFKPTDFSFNAGEGRCQTCKGTGVEHVEMQFLSDIDLPCPTCHGKRYRDDILAVRRQVGSEHVNIDDVLNWTVDQAVSHFASYFKLTQALKPLQDVGLGYLRLGQPLSTLSAGECQRIKLAASLATIYSERRPKRRVFCFDEPTNGLHLADIDQFVGIMDMLVEQGHTVIIIEHQLDVIGAADWVIELGPEGGDLGGQVVFMGSPKQMRQAQTLTGQALTQWLNALDDPQHSAPFFELDTPTPAPLDDGHLHVIDATEHNLKHLSVSLPRDALTVVTGPSGSGKSTLAFDIIFAEGQRRYLESLNAYARSMVQPPPVPQVKEVRGLSPTVAIEQRTSRGGLRSTVATMTEIYHFLRLLYVKLGTPFCPSCHVPAKSQSVDEIMQSLSTLFAGQDLGLVVPLITGQKGAFTQLFKDLKATHEEVYVDGQWHKLATITGLARYEMHNVAVLDKTLNVDDPGFYEALKAAIAWGQGRVWIRHHIDEPMTLFSLDSRCPQCNTSFPALDSRLFSYNASTGACPTCTGYGIITAQLKKLGNDKNLPEHWLNELSDDEGTASTCPSCHGARLAPFARSVQWKNLSIDAWGAMTIDEALAYVKALELTDRERAIGQDALNEITTRLHFLVNVGLGYLNLNRSAPTLSGGEAQRIRLAAQLGSNLQGACYILDEPTIGLHARDNAMLIAAMRQLAQEGNTVLVVEHDAETIRQADYVVDIGPGSGSRGGELLVAGSLTELMQHPRSLTGKMLSHPAAPAQEPRHAVNPDRMLVARQLHANNVHLDEIQIPLQSLCVVTGVSGSGKSTLTRGLIYPRLKAYFTDKAWPHDVPPMLGVEHIDRLLEVDQTPIGKNPRSCPATYIGFFDDIRQLFAQTPDSQMRGYGANRYSFNVKGGRCAQCEGQGLLTLAMSFMPDVKIQCDSCQGLRFNPETLMVTYKGKSIGEVLQMSVDEAVEFFGAVPKIYAPLKLMQDVGLGYLTLGQPSPTLSGGEAQRIKLVTELSKASTERVRLKTPKTLYVLDEPTVGLHMADVAKLMDVLNRLVDAGHSVVVVEHNLDLIANADWVIDMGPEGGFEGGQVVGQGTPRELARLSTPTGRALKAYFEEHHC